MKTATWMTVLALGSQISTGRCSNITDLSPYDGNVILSQYDPGGQLFAGIQHSEPSSNLDMIFTLDSEDLQATDGIHAFWFDIKNSSPVTWKTYELNFFDSNFAGPLGVAFHAFGQGPVEMLPDWEFPPHFSRVETVLLSGGTGVPPGQEFHVVTLFEFTSFVPKGSTEFSFGIRQSVTATVPEVGSTLGFLGIGLLGVLGWRAPRSFRSRDSTPLFPAVANGR